MDTGIVAIIAALIAAFPPTITAIANARASKKDNKATRDQIEKVNKAVEHTEEELKQHREMLIHQGELIAKQERAFQERKKHEELQNEIALANMTSTQVILEALHQEGKVNGSCEQQRNKLKELEHKMAAQALHLDDDDIKY